LHQASGIRVVSFEELGGSVMMLRGLIAMTRCGGVVFQARMSGAHVLSDFAMIAMRLTASQSKRDSNLSDLDGGTLGNYFVPPSTGEFFQTDPRQVSIA
jgi:hypothetical protein